MAVAPTANSCFVTMSETKPPCPLCGNPDSVGGEWPHPNGKLYRTCFKLNQDSHLGRMHHFEADTGEPLHTSNRHDALLFNVLSHAKPAGFRGFDSKFLFENCNVGIITAAELDRNLVDKPEFGAWAREREDEGFFVSMLPCMAGADLVGIHFRAFHRKTGDANANGDNVRTFGKADSIYVPCYAAVNPCAIIIHEGPWGAIAANADAKEYGNADIFSVAVLSANFKVETLRATLELIFPGVPRFSLFDQDPAGVTAREKALQVAKPISIKGCGAGKDYRDIDPLFRFEALCEAVRKELKYLEAAPVKAVPVIPSGELDACLCKLPMTEYGLADRFVERHGRICKFIDGWKHWTVFDGTRWIRSNPRAEAMAQDVIKRLEHEAHHLKEEE